MDRIWAPAVYPTETLHAGELEVAVSDAREAVLERKFRVPVMTWPGQGASKQLALHDDTRTILSAKAQRLLGGGAAELLFEARSVRGVAGWNAHVLDEEAFAEVEVELRCFSVRRRALLASSSGHASGYLRSLDTDDEQPIELFDRALLRAFEEAITRPMFVHLVNSALCAMREGPCGDDQPIQNATAAVSTNELRPLPPE